MEKSELIEYKNMYVVLLPDDEKHIICMASDGTWDDNYYNDFNNYSDNYNYNYNNYRYDFNYTPLVNNPFKG
jgi:hypothetical protein